MQEIRDWFTTPLGESVLKTEERVLEQLLQGFFGYHLFQLSPQDKALYGSSVIQHKLKLTADLVQSGENDLAHSVDPSSTVKIARQSNQLMDSLASFSDELPFADDSLDVVLLHHMLEYSSSPQRLLREAARVSLPMGQLVVVGFNPHSLWGLAKPVGKFRKKTPWTGRFVPPGQLMDWLTLLNFKIDRAHYCMYGLPSIKATGSLPDFSHGLSRNANWPFGGVYVIVARKQVGSMIKMKPAWQNRAPFGKLSVVQPARPTAGRGISTRDIPADD